MMTVLIKTCLPTIFVFVLVYINLLNVVVVYDCEFGTYLGSRMSKRCKSCKVFEHYGYYPFEGMRHVDDNILKKEYLLSTKETAIQMSLPKQCSNLIIF